MASFAIVGGGVSGLACAWRLTRAGHDVEVLERADAPGGRVRSESRGDLRIERGAGRISSGDRNLHAALELLGLSARVEALRGGWGAVLRGGGLEPADAPGRAPIVPRLVSTRSRLRLLRLPLELRRHRSVLDPLRPELAAGLDRDDAATWLARAVGEEARDAAIAPLIRAAYGSELGDLSSAFLLLALDASRDARPQTLAGGLGILTTALAAEVRVRSGCEVVSVETETDGARLRYRVGERERRVFADAVVLAVPGPLVPALCPKLGPDERGFFEGVTYAHGTVVHLVLEREPPSLRRRRVAFPASEGFDLAGVSIDQPESRGSPSRTCVVTASLSEAASRRLEGEADAQVAERVLCQLARTPIGELPAAEVIVRRWPLMLPRFQPGYLPRLAAFLARSDRSPRLAFTGDYLVSPTIEGALTSGLRAASEVVRGLEQVHPPTRRGDRMPAVSTRVGVRPLTRL